MQTTGYCAPLNDTSTRNDPQMIRITISDILYKGLYAEETLRRRELVKKERESWRARR